MILDDGREQPMRDADARATELTVRVREMNRRSSWEREGKAVRAAVASSPVGCVECAELKAAWQKAASGVDHERAVDAGIALRSHFRDEHLLPRDGW
ncbi:MULTISPECIES: hypothetical protein [Streptomyces]|uniref:Uncharacterized protein n=1 Tax=Streptomyces ehimensis TaxID=68195 RepID=A0ABV9BQ81_9ACTN